MLDRKGADLRIKPKVRHNVLANFAGKGWALLLYAGAFMGLQRQVRLNAIRVSVATLQSGGTIFVLWALIPMSK